jgi:amidophosphoribosyltransferase
MCGVCGIFNHEKASEVLYLGLFALQHRGQDNAGMAVWDGQQSLIVKDKGLVFDIFKPGVLAELKGSMGIGHTRYPTAGDSSIANAQPHYADTKDGRMVIVSNGDITNMLAQTRYLKSQGFTPYGSNDAEVIVASIACYYEQEQDMAKAVKKMMETVLGSYSAILMFNGTMYVFRDPLGIRPLAMGRKGATRIFASESCAIDTIGGIFEREVAPGELLTVKDQGLESQILIDTKLCKHCVFEHIYFSRPDSVIFGESVAKKRFMMGQRLASEQYTGADFVMPVPDSSNNAALGFAEENGIPYKLALIRSHYIGRTFIGSTQEIRDFAVRLKFNPDKSLISGKTVAVVDDSIVRGTTSKKIMNMIREAGARGIHMRIASPPIKHPCYYGVDTPRINELIASTKSVEEIREFVGVDSLNYLTLAGLRSCLERPQDFCFACLDGKYPIEPPSSK